MRILIKEVLDIDPDSAWRALRSPAVLREVSTPLVGMGSLEGGFPTIWTGGAHLAGLEAFGVVPIGAQSIDISFRRVPSQPGVRMMRDSGRGLSGALGLVTEWEHSMAVSAAPGGKTLYRDQLVFGAGAATLAAWPALWAFWQWRGLRLKQLAPSWRLDLAADAAVPTDDTDAEPRA